MSNTYLINPIVSLDGQHVMSHSEDYDNLTNFFSSSEFAEVVNDRDLDKELLAEISQEYTNYLRTHWLNTSVAVVSRMAADAQDNVTEEAVNGKSDNAVFRVTVEAAVLSSYEK